MKNKTIILTAVLAISLTVFTYTSRANTIPKLNIPMSGQEVPQINYELTADINTLPIEGTVYKFITPNNDEAKIVAEKLNFTQELKPDTQGNKYMAKQGEKWFTYEKDTGCWAFQNMAALDDISIGKIIPSDEEAIEIAKKFLKQKDLLKDRFNNIVVVSQTSGDTLTNDYRVNYKDVFFYPTINNVPILGVSRIIVSIGHNGEVIAVNKYYKDYQLHKVMKVKSAKDAFEKVKSNKASNNIDPRAKSAKITKVRLAYWEDAGTIAEQPYLQPVWVFEGEATTDDGDIKKFDAVVPAI